MHSIWYWTYETRLMKQRTVACGHWQRSCWDMDNATLMDLLTNQVWGREYGQASCWCVGSLSMWVALYLRTWCPSLIGHVGRSSALGASVYWDWSCSPCYCSSVSWAALCSCSVWDMWHDTPYVLFFALSYPEWYGPLMQYWYPPVSPPVLSISTLVWRYVHKFVKMDAKEALQYVYCMCLTTDQGDGVGREKLEDAWELIRQIIVLGNSGPGWRN